MQPQTKETSETKEASITVGNRPSRPSMPPVKMPRLGGRFLGVVFLLLISIGGGWLGGLWSASHHTLTSLDTKTQKEVVSSESQLISGIAKDDGPSVVSINVTGQSAPTDFFGFSGGGGQQQQSAGTGFILSADGVIITNRHVVPAGSTKVSVTLADGTTLNDVSVIGRTSDSDSLDIAFLKVNNLEGKKLQPIALGDSSKTEVGDKVVAIGNALGQFQNTVTAGIISGHGRSVQAGDSSGSGSTETLEDLFQTDAAINEGNSGGPLVDSSGDVIGINTAIAGDAQNIGFAIPINDVKGLITSVLQKGKLLRPFLGVRYVSITPDVADQYSLSTNNGAYVIGDSGNPAIQPGSPAEKAGLQEKDIITKVNDTTIDSNNSLTSVLGRSSVGDTVTLTIIRDGKTITIKATLAAAPTS